MSYWCKYLRWNCGSTLLPITQEQQQEQQQKQPGEVKYYQIDIDKIPSKLLKPAEENPLSDAIYLARSLSEKSSPYQVLSLAFLLYDSGDYKRTEIVLEKLEGDFHDDKLLQAQISLLRAKMYANENESLHANQQIKITHLLLELDAQKNLLEAYTNEKHIPERSKSDDPSQ